MIRYLISGSYTQEGARGILTQGGTTRQGQIREMIEKLGGKMETFYWAFGESDFYIICELPDAASAAAIGLTASGAGAVRTKTTVLLTAEDIDKAQSLHVDYQVPGAKKLAA